MTDKELLEFAAKAILTTEHYENKDYMRGWFSNWNPLTDDGDALRLAVLLSFEVDLFSGRVAVRTHNGIKILEEVTRNPYAATRRAIVRAAAEIGKTL